MSPFFLGILGQALLIMVCIIGGFGALACLISTLTSWGAGILERRDESRMALTYCRAHIALLEHQLGIVEGLATTDEERNPDVWPRGHAEYQGMCPVCHPGRVKLPDALTGQNSVAGPQEALAMHARPGASHPGHYLDTGCSTCRNGYVDDVGPVEANPAEILGDEP